jgi:hypothetical protein
MADSDIRKGHCLCGAVTLAARITSDGIMACHCQQCQRWTGGGPLINVRAADVALSGEDAITHVRISEWGERGFCGTCGSTPYWWRQDCEISSLAIGLFDDQSGWTMKEEIFTDRRPDWLPHFDGASQSTEAEEFAKLDKYLEGDAS